MNALKTKTLILAACALLACGGGAEEGAEGTNPPGTGGTSTQPG